MTKGEILGQGSTADIFAWGEDQALKLFLIDEDPGQAEKEATLTRTIHNAGLPSPRVIDVVTIEHREGIIYERLDGISMLDQITSTPWLLRKMAYMLAELQTELHQHTISTLPSKRHYLIERIERAPQLTTIQRQAILDHLAHLPNGRFLCHGDFHPDNIILTNQGPVIIDWTNATQGHPLADVARTSMLMRLGKLPPHISRLEHLFINLIRQLFNIFYQQRYRQLHPTITAKEMAAWQLPTVAACLTETLAEPADLLAIINTNLIKRA